MTNIAPRVGDLEPNILIALGVRDKSNPTTDDVTLPQSKPVDCFETILTKDDLYQWFTSGEESVINTGVGQFHRYVTPQGSYLGWAPLTLFNRWSEPKVFFSDFSRVIPFEVLLSETIVRYSFGDLGQMSVPLDMFSVSTWCWFVDQAPKSVRDILFHPKQAPVVVAEGKVEPYNQSTPVSEVYEDPQVQVLKAAQGQETLVTETDYAATALRHRADLLAWYYSSGSPIMTPIGDFRRLTTDQGDRLGWAIPGHSAWQIKLSDLSTIVDFTIKAVTPMGTDDRVLQVFYEIRKGDQLIFSVGVGLTQAGFDTLLRLVQQVREFKTGVYVFFHPWASIIVANGKIDYTTRPEASVPETPAPEPVPEKLVIDERPRLTASVIDFTQTGTGNPTPTSESADQHRLLQEMQTDPAAP